MGMRRTMLSTGAVLALAMAAAVAAYLLMFEASPLDRTVTAFLVAESVATGVLLVLLPRERSLSVA